MKKNTIVRHCFSRKYISLCIFLLLGIIGEKAFAYSVAQRKFLVGKF